MKSLKIVTLVSVLVLVHGSLSSGFVVHDPFNLIQNTQTALSSAKNTLELIEQSKRQIQQLENSVKNLKKLSDNDWLTIQSFLQNASNQIQQSQLLASSMAKIALLFEENNPDYQTKKNYATEYMRWSNTVSKTFDDGLKLMKIQTDSIVTEHDLLENLSRLSKTSEGRMQAMQAANLIATEQASQLQKLRELMLSQSTLQLAYLSHQHQQKKYEHITIEKMIKDTHVELKRYGTGKGFGEEDIPTLTRPLL